MKIDKVDIIKDLTVGYYGWKNKFYSRATVHFDGYDIQLEVMYFDNIDEALASIKQRISEAVIKFYDKEIELWEATNGKNT